MATRQVTDFAELALKTHVVYEEHGAAFDQQRPKGLHEKKWLDHFLELLPEGASILDVGCGAGEPFIPYFLSRGVDVEGLDFAMTMLKIARSRFPQLTFHHMNMCRMQIGKQYDGIIAWNSFFHLTRDSQRQALERFSEHLKSRGIIMLTVGPRAGEVVGHVNGAEVYHASFDPDQYAEILGDLGIRVLEFVAEDEACDQQTVLIGCKSA